MINKPNVEELLKNCKNRYELVTAISKRARQITAGSTPKVVNKGISQVTTASMEFDQNKYSIL